MADLDRLRHLHDAIGGEYGELVSRFYARLEAEEHSGPLLPPPARRSRLQGAMQRQFEELLTAERGDLYRHGRLALARRHLETGVPPSIYVRSFGVFTRCLLEMLDERGMQPAREDLEELVLAMLEDIGQVLDAGDEARRLAEEDAEQERSRALAIERRERDARVETVQRLAAAAEFRDTDTGQHVQRTAHYSALLAEAAGMDLEFVERLRIAAPMHDLGKIGIPDSILLKPGKLTAPEWAVMQTHAELGWRLLQDSDSPLLQLGAEIAWTHHERWDGSGYPRGLAGEAIPISGRIVCVADVLDALTSKRVYKDAFSMDVALEELRKGRGTHFDPQLIGLVLALVPRFEAVRARYAD
jgi:HD-GYP domain-containing protein (c-di-GMP phosphodiesterase class II)